jgi:hypothetical protein
VARGLELKQAVAADVSGASDDENVHGVLLL